MRPRRRRSHSRRQTEVIFNPDGGVLVGSGVQGGVAGDNTAQRQQPFGITSGEQVSSTMHTQPGHHTISSSGSQPSSSLAVSASAPTSHATPTNALSSRTTNSRESSSLRSNALSTMPISSGSNLSRLSGAAATTTSASHFSASASSAPTMSGSTHSVGFYVGVGFGAIVLIACFASFAAWLLRMRQKGSTSYLGSKHDEDVENRDSERGLRLYLDKPRDGFGTQMIHSTPFPDTRYPTAQGNHPRVSAFHKSGNSQYGYPSTTMRPVAPHSNTEGSIQAPDRLLGPLSVRNYASGDLPSSCDEAAPSPKHELGSPRELQPGGTPRYLGVEGQGLYTPWAPLSIKPRTPKSVNLTQSPVRKSEAARSIGEEQNYLLPTPPFGRTRRDREGGSPNGWGDTLRSSINAALSGTSGNDPRAMEGVSPALPGGYTRSDRWRTVLASQRVPVADAVTSESVNRTLANPNVNASNHPLSGFGQGVAAYDSIGLRLRMEERLDGGSASMVSIRPLTISKKRVTEGGGKESLGNVMPRTMSRESSAASLLPSGRSARCLSRRTKRPSVKTQTCLASRVRPEFLRQPTAGSVTSFSSEASEPPGALTEEELRAKRTMMLRARRKRGLGVSAGTGKGGLSRRVTQASGSPDAEQSEA